MFKNISKISSILSIVPFFIISYYVGRLVYATLLQDNLVVEAEIVSWFMDLSLSDPLLKTSVYLQCTLIIFQFIYTLIQISYFKTKMTLWEVTKNIFFGGIFSVVSMAVRPIFNKLFINHEKVIISANGAKKLTNYSALTLIASLFTLTPMTFTNGVDVASSSEEVSISLDKSDPNIFYIFIDGLSTEQYNDYITQTDVESFEGFVHLPTSVSSGLNTLYGAKGMLAGEEFSELFIYDNKEGWDDFGKYDAVREMFNIYASEGQQQNLLGTTGFVSDYNDFALGWSGEVEVASRELPEANVVNYKGAQQVANRSGTYGYAPSGYFYDYPISNHVVGKSSVTYLTDYSIHFPYMTDSDGTFKQGATEKESFKGTFKLLSNLFDGLKGIKNDTTNAYDNSTIIISTDHGSHFGDFPSDDNPGNKFHTSTFIKFPDFTGDLSSFEDVALWNPHIKNIFQDWENSLFSNRDDFINYLTTNENFSIDRDSYVTVGKNTFNGDGVTGMMVGYDLESSSFEYSKVYKNENYFSLSAATNYWPNILSAGVRWK